MPLSLRLPSPRGETFSQSVARQIGGNATVTTVILPFDGIEIADDGPMRNFLPVGPGQEIVVFGEPEEPVFGRPYGKFLKAIFPSSVKIEESIHRGEGRKGARSLSPQLTHHERVAGLVPRCILPIDVRRAFGDMDAVVPGLPPLHHRVSEIRQALADEERARDDKVEDVRKQLVKLEDCLGLGKPVPCEGVDASIDPDRDVAIIKRDTHRAQLAAQRLSMVVPNCCNELHRIFNLLGCVYRLATKLPCGDSSASSGSDGWENLSNPDSNYSTPPNAHSQPPPAPTRVFPPPPAPFPSRPAPVACYSASNPLLDGCDRVAIGEAKMKSKNAKPRYRPYCFTCARWPIEGGTIAEFEPFSSADPSVVEYLSIDAFAKTAGDASSDAQSVVSAAGPTPPTQQPIVQPPPQQPTSSTAPTMQASFHSRRIEGPPAKPEDIMSDTMTNEQRYLSRKMVDVLRRGTMPPDFTGDNFGWITTDTLRSHLPDCHRIDTSDTAIAYIVRRSHSGTAPRFTMRGVRAGNGTVTCVVRAAKRREDSAHAHPAGFDLSMMETVQHILSGSTHTLDPTPVAAAISAPPTSQTPPPTAQVQPASICTTTLLSFGPQASVDDARAPTPLPAAAEPRVDSNHSQYKSTLNELTAAFANADNLEVAPPVYAYHQTGESRWSSTVTVYTGETFAGRGFIGKKNASSDAARIAFMCLVGRALAQSPKYAAATKVSWLRTYENARASARIM